MTDRRVSDAGNENQPAGDNARRLAAIAVIDVVSYTRLMEADEIGTHARWKTLCAKQIFPGLEKHTGQIVKSTGDGFMIEFRSVVSAVEWALELQASIAAASDENALRLRVAVHIGDIISGEQDIFGSDVNITARLQGFAEPGRVVISSVVHDRVRSAVSYSAEDLGFLELKNINEPVRAYSIGPPRINPSDTHPVIGASDPPIAPSGAEPSIAIMPLRILGGAAINPYAAEGIIHAIADSLAGLKELFVVSSSSTVALSDVAGDKAAIGRRLGARYLLTGVIGTADERFRLHVELSDLETNRTIWREHFNIEIAEIFNTQDTIATRIASSLVPHIRQSELQRALRKKPEHMGAYDLVLQALHRLFRFSLHDFEKAGELLQRAISRDPSYSVAYAWLAIWQIFRLGQGYSRDHDVESREARRLAQLALDNDPFDALALAVYGHTSAFLFGEHEAALDLFERATAYNPNSALCWGLSSSTYVYVGQYEEAIRRAKRAIALSPFDPFGFFFQTSLVMASYFTDDFESAILWGKKTLARHPYYSANMRPLIASLVAVEREDEAAQIAQTLLEIEPEFTVSGFVKRYPIKDKSLMKAYGERLCAAGLPWATKAA